MADTLLSIMLQDLEVPHICIQVPENYMSVQAVKAALKEATS